MKDLYQILGVPESADDATIKKAYRKLAKEYHPDVTGGDKKKTERFKEINEAYAVLGDAKKREEYERLRRSPVGADGMPEGFDPDAFAQAFGGGRRGAGGVTFSGDFDVNDLFSSLFGRRGPTDAFGGGFGPGGRVRPRVSRGADVRSSVQVSFTEAALGTKRRVRTPTGRLVEVQIPPGVDTGGRLRVAGQGEPAPSGSRGGQPGDLYLELTVEPHPHLRRSGDDIEVDLPVSVAEAALGARVDVPSVDGGITVSVPPGTPSGARLRLREKGVKKSDGSRGDQLCRVLVIPPKVGPGDPELRRALEEVARLTSGQKVRSF